MFAYHRSTSHATAIQRILCGSLTGTLHDVVLVKPTCLELRQLDTSDVIDDLLTLSFRQPSFGNITDASVVHCHFLEQDKSEKVQDDDDDDDEDMASVSIDFPYVVKVRQGHAPVPGDDVIIVISEYGKLVFLTINTPQDGNLAQNGRFEPLAEICMDEPGLEFSKVNKKLAVDPYSRAIAVSAYEDRFDIMIMSEAISRTHFDPIVGRGSIEEEGIIWHMEFLHTESNSRDRILLALMIFNDVEVKCWISVYAIDATNPDDVLVERIGRLPLDANGPIPILFIPLKHHPEAFVIVTNCEAALVTVEDIVSGNMFYPTCLIPRPFGEVTCPLLTSYAIPDSDSLVPYIYIGSDNGQFFKLSFPSPQVMNWDIMERINPAGSSMCILGVMDIPADTSETRGNYQADILIYSGEGADSQVLAIDREHKRPPLLIQNFENRAPITDMRAAMSDNECGQDMIVSCSGQGDQGALCLFQRGIKTKSISSSSNNWQHISRVWSTVVSDADNSRLPLLLTSSAVNSKVLSTRYGDITDMEQLQADKPLVGAGSINVESKDYLVKAYPDEIVVVDVTAQDPICAQWRPTGNEIITLAAIPCANAGIAQIALVVFNDGQSSLVLLSAKLGSNHSDNIMEANSRLLCQTEPSYIGYLQIKNRTMLVIGTFKPSVQFYDTSSHRLELLEHIDLEMIQGLDNCAIPHSMSVITSENDEKQSILMLGLRVGCIVCFQIDQDNQLLFDKKATPFIRQLGRRAVKFDPTLTTRSSTLALSDQLWRVQYNDLYPGTVEIEPILLPWMEDIEQVVSFSIDGLHHEFTGVVADDSFHVVQLSGESTVTAEKIHLGETPTRFMIDSAFSHNAFVLTSVIDSNNFRNKNTLYLVDTRSPNNQNQILLNERVFQPTDEVLCMAEWMLQHRNKTYRYLCLGVGQMNMTTNRTRIKKIGAERGTLMIYRLKQGKNEHVRYTLRPVMNKELTGGVFAICPHPAGLLFSAGPVLYLYQLDTDGKEAKLIEITKKPLRFLITSIQVDGDKICVTCQGDSISYYRFNSETSKLEYCKSDISARTILHSMMPHPQLVVGSSQFGGLIALWDNPEDRSFEQRLLTSFSFHYPDILIRPSLMSLLSSATLDVVTHADCIDGHLLPWDESNEATIKPILCAGVSGGLISVHRLSQPLYELLYALQERLIHFAQSLCILLGSPRDFQWYHNIGQREKHVLDGDLLSLYLRLESNEQRQVVELVDDQLFPSILDPVKVFLYHNSSLHSGENVTSIQIALLLERLLRALGRCC